MPTVRYFAAAKAAAELGEEHVEGSDLEQVLDQARRRHGARLTAVLGVCSFLVDGAPVGSRPHGSVTVGPGSVVECLPPFAGG